MTTQTTGTTGRPSPWKRALTAPTLTKLYWLLRIGVAVEYLGHGWAGLSRSKAWLPYYDLFGISAQAATDYLMYLTGAFDITVGIIVLLWPARIVLLHATAWGVFTALLRPIVGEGWWEFLERGGNYGMPLALLAIVGLGGRSVRGWLTRADAPRAVSDKTWITAHWAARGGLALLLIGHGGFGAFEDKAFLYTFFDYFGIGRAAVQDNNLLVVFGIFEILLGIAVLIKPAKSLVIFILVWKVITELLRPLVGQPWFQFVERVGDYVLPPALLLIAAAYAVALARTRSGAPAAAAVAE
ncbi:hypothetical protein ACIA8O_24870 [Kitasatospora sp. NPDC051853]|uniref:hypothetical protein n=1 Tax=Kitasatospora sp. NPDC051853 TaxID=3364058 RepID=UPI003794DD9E